MNAEPIHLKPTSHHRVKHIPKLQPILTMRRSLLHTFKRPLTWSPPAISRSFTVKRPPTTPRNSIDRINARLPKFLHRFTNPLRTAPVSHITAFLILHEITAVLPLFAFAGAFHYFDYLPHTLVDSTMVKESSEKFGRYLRRKGWVGQEAEKRGGGEGAVEEVYAAEGRYQGEEGVKVVLEIATAYAVTKALLPLRLVASAWATPWFARWTSVPIFGVARRLFGRGSVKAATSPGAGTGAVGGGVLPTATGAGQVSKRA